jgi:hypothetical protein
MEKTGRYCTVCESTLVPLLLTARVRSQFIFMVAGVPFRLLVQVLTVGSLTAQIAEVLSGQGAEPA